MRWAASIDFLRSAGLKTPIEISAPFIADRAQFGERWISFSIVASTFAANENLSDVGRLLIRRLTVNRFVFACACNSRAAFDEPNDDQSG